MNRSEISKLVDYKLVKARNTIVEAELLINNKMWNAAVNRIYYACFYAVNALMVNHNLNARKHSGVIQMFGLHFIHTGIITKEAGKFYSVLFDMRQSGDYSDYVNFEEMEVIGLLEPATMLINQIESVIRR